MQKYEAEIILIDSTSRCLTTFEIQMLYNYINNLERQNDELQQKIDKLEEELEESREFEDPVLKAHDNFSKTVTRLITPETILHNRVKKEHKEGIPFEEEECITIL